jgi:hypothetical protein
MSKPDVVITTGENLSGKLPLHEFGILAQAYRTAGLIKALRLVSDLDRFDPNVPEKDICQLAAQYTALIYASPILGDYIKRMHIQLPGHTGWKPANYECHYDTVTEEYGELDFTRTQFKAGREIHEAKPEKKLDENKMGNWSNEFQMPKILRQFHAVVFPLIQSDFYNTGEHTWTPQFSAFIKAVEENKIKILIDNRPR